MRGMMNFGGVSEALVFRIANLIPLCFTFRNGFSIILLLVYVDDLILTSNDPHTINHLI